MKAKFLLFISFLALNASIAQTTYTWNVANGDFTTAANWTPTRTTPATNDILVFNGSTTANATVTNIPKQTIGKLRCINNVSVRLVGASRVAGAGTISRASTAVTGSSTAFLADLREGDLLFNATTTFYGEVTNITTNTNLVTSASGTLSAVTYFMTSSISIGDGTATALDILPGSTLTLGDSGAEPLGLRLLTGSKANIQGTVRMLYARQRIIGIDSASVLIKSGGVIKTDSSFSGNPFLIVGGQNTIIFESGSTFDYVVGSNPFAQTAPASKCLFMPGSRYVQLSTSTPSVSGRTFATFVSNFSGTITATQNNTAVFDSLIIMQGTTNINASSSTTINHIHLLGGTLAINPTAGNVNILGNITANAGSNLILNGKYTSTPANINFRGITQQTISGIGNIRISGSADSTVRFRIQNNAGVLLLRDLTLNAAILDLDSGSLLLNANTGLLLGSDALGFHGRATQLTGVVRGAGILSRWYTTSAHSFGDSSLFPIGSATAIYPTWVAGSATISGSVHLMSFTENNGITSMGTPFADVAPHGSINVSHRLNHAWTISTTGLAGSNFAVRLSSPVANGWVTDSNAMRVTLANGIAPGTSENGGGTLTMPTATKIGLSATQLNNTFYMGTSSINPLPVNFVSVSAKANNTINVVDWTTATEINLLHFEVEKLNNNNSFEAIGKVRATNSRSLTHYTFNDVNGGSAVYRIKAINFDGSVEYSKTAVVVGNSLNNVFTIWPNPALNQISISSNANDNIDGVTVYNLIGEKMSVKFTQNTIDLTTIKAGVYYLHLTTSNQTQVVKFVKL